MLYYVVVQTWHLEERWACLSTVEQKKEQKNRNLRKQTILVSSPSATLFETLTIPVLIDRVIAAGLPQEKKTQWVMEIYLLITGQEEDTHFFKQNCHGSVRTATQFC